ncbi:hypothetical protein PMAYCL1PPCAC_16269, partial [Pristionchus mayeri]
LTFQFQRIAAASTAMACTDLTAAYFSFPNLSDRTVYPDGAVMTWSDEIMKEYPDSTRVHTELIAAIKKAEVDKREYVLLKIILVCNEVLDGLAPLDRERLRLLKERLFAATISKILNKALIQGPAFYGKIISIIDVIIKHVAWKK